MEKETGLSPEELAEEMLKEAGLYVNSLVDKFTKEILEQREMLVEKGILKEEEKKEKNELLKELIYETDRYLLKQIKGFGKFRRKDIQLMIYDHEAIRKVFELAGILDIQAKEYCTAHMCFTYAGMPNKMEEVIDDLESKEKESAEKGINNAQKLLHTNRDYRTLLEKLKYFGDNFVKAYLEHHFLDQYLLPPFKEKEKIKKDIKKLGGKIPEGISEEILEDWELLKLWNRFAGRRLSKIKKERKEKTRKEMPGMVGKKYKENQKKESE